MACRDCNYGAGVLPASAVVVGSQIFLSVTDNTALLTSKHARNCVRRARGLVLTGHPEPEPSEADLSAIRQSSGLPNTRRSGESGVDHSRPPRCRDQFSIPFRTRVATRSSRAASRRDQAKPLHHSPIRFRKIALRFHDDHPSSASFSSSGERHISFLGFACLVRLQKIQPSHKSPHFRDQLRIPDPSAAKSQILRNIFFDVSQTPAKTRSLPKMPVCQSCSIESISYVKACATL